MEQTIIAMSLLAFGISALAVIRRNHSEDGIIQRRLKEVAEQGPVDWRGERDIKPWGDVVEIPAAAKAGGGLGTAAGTPSSNRHIAHDNAPPTP